jgi:hypothetical protein
MPLEGALTIDIVGLPIDFLSNRGLERLPWSAVGLDGVYLDGPQ